MEIDADARAPNGHESEGWLTAICRSVFEEEAGLQEQCRRAAEYAAKRQDMKWRLTHNGLHDRAGPGLIETAAGRIHFERGQAQQSRAWDCSLVLVKYLEKHPEEVRGKKILELGCGVGLPGVAAAMLGADEVILTDMVAGLPAIERTIELNPHVSDRLTGSILQWGDDEQLTELLTRVERGTISVVLCSDLLYGDDGGNRSGYEDGGQKGEMRENEDNKGGPAEMLAATLSALCAIAEETSGSDVVVLNCHERRFSGDKGAYFFEVMEQRGFEVVENVHLSSVDEHYDDDCGISLTRIKRARKGIPPAAL